jgi:catechol 2,3-dioxygenase
VDFTTVTTTGARYLKRLQRSGWATERPADKIVSMLDAPVPPRLGHAAIIARDPERAADFYRAWLGLQIVRRTSNPLAGDAVLLSGDPRREDHELAVLTDPRAGHVAFRVDTLEQLRAFYTRAKRQGLPIPYALDSGVALGFFVRDPEGNAVEIYLARPEPWGGSLPLSDPDLIDELILGG